MSYGLKATLERHQSQQRLCVLGAVSLYRAAPRLRGLGMVFQNYALMPHMTVFENIAFPLRVESLPEDEIRRRVGDAAATMTASFLNYAETPTGRELLLEPIRRFGYGAAVGIVIDDTDMDTTDELDVVDFVIKKPDGTTVTMKAVETDVHSGRFIGRVFPVEGTPDADYDGAEPEAPEAPQVEPSHGTPTRMPGGKLK